MIAIEFSIYLKSKGLGLELIFIAPAMAAVPALHLYIYVLALAVTCLLVSVSKLSLLLCSVGRSLKMTTVPTVGHHNPSSQLQFGKTKFQPRNSRACLLVSVRQSLSDGRIITDYTSSVRTVCVTLYCVV